MRTILICNSDCQSDALLHPFFRAFVPSHRPSAILFPNPLKMPTPQRAKPWLLLAFVSVLMLPVLAVLAAWLQPDGQSFDILRQMQQTVLPGYVWTTMQLCLLVALGVALVGTAAAATVALFDFPQRRFFQWALLLPLAMPAYVMAFAYTDFLQFSGPLQTALRSAFGWQGALLPEVRSIGGAALVFTFSLYPYVYLLVRAALADRASGLMETARLLGAGLPRRIASVALPLARPALAAGMALALMETLADYGVSSYFGIQTFTVGIYKAWLAMDSRVAAAQLASLLLLLVALLVWLERRAQQKMRFASGRAGRAQGADAALVRLQGGRAALAWVLCAVPVLLGFVLPVLFMLRPLVGSWATLPWSRFAEWTLSSLKLSGIGTVLAVGLALLLAFALRRNAGSLPTRLAVQLAGLGYAVPGAVIVVGLLLPVGWLQNAYPQSGAGFWVTGTVLGVVWAYMVRFTAVALQTIGSGYSRIPPSFDDTAQMLGSTGSALFMRVHAPLLKRSVATALLLVFVDSLKELPATLVLRPFNSDTLAVVAFQLARDERLGEAALPSLALVLAGLVPVLLLSRSLRSGHKA